MILLLSGVFALSFLVTLNAVPRLMALAWKKGFLDHPGPRKVHTRPIPYGGGLGVAAGTLVPVLLAAAVAVVHAWIHPLSLPAELAVHVPGILSQVPRLLLLVSASLLILFLGLADDKWKLPPRTKLTVEILVALGIALGYERLSLFSEGSVAGDLLGTAATVVWIVGVTNAFNLLDHMDGLSSGVAAIVSACFLAVAILTGQWFLAAFLVSLLGACSAFLIFNFPPAKVFLGDAGSLFLGFLLACLTVTFTFYRSADDHYPLYSYAVPIIVLAVPLFDTTSVVWIRLREGRNPMEGDTNHFAHRLTALGLSPRAAVFVIYALTLVTGLSAVLLYQVKQSGALIIAAQVAIVFAIITVLESKGRDGRGS